jgi:hypothetical protein
VNARSASGLIAFLKDTTTPWPLIDYNQHANHGLGADCLFVRSCLASRGNNEAKRMIHENAQNKREIG